MPAKSKILVVSTPFPTGGGGSLRALRSVREYAKHFDVHLFLPYGAKRLALASPGHLHDLIRSGLFVAGLSRLPVAIDSVDSALADRIPTTLTKFFFSFVARPKLFARGGYECVVSLHEDVDSVYAGYVLSDLFDAPAVCLLQLPPFYGSKERLRSIAIARALWRRYAAATRLAEPLLAAEALAEQEIVNELAKRVYGHVLRRYNVVLSVSRSIPHEMGSEWVNRVYSFDPGVSLDEGDLELMERIKARTKERGDYIVFGGRPVAWKGVVEALLAFRYIAKRFSSVRLVFTGSVSGPTLRRLERVRRRLGVEDKVLFMGFVPRSKRLEVVAKARLVLYPSHVDGFPYAVLEALHLGTPVVAYDIPALRLLYYSRNPGVRLVKELDLEALATEVADVLERGVDAIEPPKVPSWEEIVSKEVAIIEKVVGRARR